MMISTKGRYALRVMIDIAEHQHDGYIPLKEIAARQEISEKYLEAIVKSLVKERYLQGLRGKSGGYRLTRHPREYTTEAILKLTEGSMLPISCVTTESNPCPRATKCTTLPFWQGLQEVIEDYLRNVTLEDLAIQQKEAGCDYGAGI